MSYPSVYVAAVVFIIFMATLCPVFMHMPILTLNLKKRTWNSGQCPTEKGFCTCHQEGENFQHTQEEAPVEDS